MRGKKGTMMLIILVTAASVWGWEITYTADVSWDTATLYLDLTAGREPGDPSLPAARAAAEKAMERALPLICLDAAAAIRTDSRRSLGDVMEKDKDVLGALRDLYLLADRGTGSFTPDLSGLKVRYSIKLFPHLVAPLVRHDRAFQIEHRLDWEPTGPFTGILIYARGEYPEYGKPGVARLEPCLLPEIYDQDMNLLAAPYMTDPEILKNTGPVLYTHSLEDKRILDRVGYYPMRITLRQVFGISPTNLVIPREWGDKIRSSREIQQLIARGRVVIVIDPPETAPTASSAP